MSELNGGIADALEVVQPIPDIEQPLIPEAGVAQNQHDAHAVAAMPEMPSLHPTIDAGTLTVGGLIKACPYYAKLAEANPELARTEAAVVVQRVQEREAMRETGMNGDAIKKQQWSAMRERHKEKVTSEERLAPAKSTREAKAEPAPQAAAAQRQTMIAEAERAVAAVQHEVVERELPERLEPSTAQTTVTEAVASVREPAKPQVAMEQIAAQAAQVAQLHAEQAHAAVAEAGAAPVVGAAAAARDAVEAAYGHARPAEQPLVVEHAAPAEYAPAPDTAELGAADGKTLEPAHDSPAPSSPELSAVPERPTWDDVLEKEPAELYSDFTKSLQAMAALPEEPALTFTEATGADEPTVPAPVDSVQESQPIPVIAATIAERLAELDTAEKAVVAPVLQEVVRAVRAVDLLITADAEPEAIKTARAELAELVTALCEQLGSEYEPEDIEHLVTMLLRPDFQPPQAEEAAVVDLEHDGTHEAKLQFAQFVSDGLSGVETAVEQLLGKVVVFYAAHHSLPGHELTAA